MCLIVLLAGGSPCASAEDRAFPADAGLVDVTRPPYSATPDDGRDDTEAIQRAISDNIGQYKIIYLPIGVYDVSDTLVWKDATGKWRCWLTLQGQNRERTILKLRDDCPGFTDAGRPKPVILTASQNPFKPDGGGNQAFGNSIYDLTVHTGRGNAGAIGIGYLANNKGTLRDVTVRSSDPARAGAAGIATPLPYPGPCLIKNVTVEGFDYGVDIEQGMYCVTMEHIRLRGQRIAGIRNVDNVVAIRGLHSENTAPAVLDCRSPRNRYGPAGFVTLLDSVCTGGEAANCAVLSEGNLFVRNLTTAGYGSALRSRGKDVPGQRVEEFVSPPAQGLFPSEQRSLNLPVLETPAYWDPQLAHWANVQSFRQPDDADDTPAIQRAVDSGKATVYFPSATYKIADTIHVRGKVKHLLGLDVALRPAARHTFTDAQNPKPIFRFETADAAVETVLFEQFNLFFQRVPGALAIEDASPRTLVVRSVISWVAGGGYRNAAGAGRLFIEDFDPGCHQHDWMEINRQEVWARQLDPEAGRGPQVQNLGGQLWILGFKTEGIGPFIATTGGGRTELLGGYNYINGGDPADTPAYVIEDSAASLSFATTCFRNGNDRDYRIYTRETRDGATKNLLRSDTIGRHGDPSNWHRIVPLYVSER